jgi:hypothetical protein
MHIPHKVHLVLWLINPETRSLCSSAINEGSRAREKRSNTVDRWLRQPTRKENPEWLLFKGKGVTPPSQARRWWSGSKWGPSTISYSPKYQNSIEYQAKWMWCVHKPKEWFFLYKETMIVLFSSIIFMYQKVLYYKFIVIRISQNWFYQYMHFLVLYQKFTPMLISMVYFDDTIYPPLILVIVFSSETQYVWS